MFDAESGGGTRKIGFVADTVAGGPAGAGLVASQRAEDAVPSLISALPEVKPGRGGVVSLPADALADKPNRHRPDQDGGSSMQVSRPAGARVGEAQQLRGCWPRNAPAAAGCTPPDATGSAASSGARPR
ncbi:ESX secretion-associated protein EspG [Saccharothrix isguenensis]